MKSILIIGSALLLAMSQAQAQDEFSPAAETGTKLETLKPADAVPKTGEADVDEVITNRKLRAETGSKNVFSFSTALEYAGGTIKDPGSKMRPNITGALGTQDAARLSGTVGVKYKISTMQSLALDIGVGVDAPFHSDQESFGERSSANNPSLSYQVLSKVAGIQSVTQVAASAYTSSFLQKVGYQAGLTLVQTMAYDFGGSNFTIGGLVELNANSFFKDASTVVTVGEETGPVGKRQGDFRAGLYPFAEYVINDRLNVRTISGLWAYDHSRAQSEFWTWNKNAIYQSVGLGISVTRDLYLYPNVQFMPENIKDERTNVALSMNLNL